MGRRFLLRPDKRLNNLFVYCLALAAQKYGIQIHAFCVMSNHYHLVLTDTEGVLPLFVAWLNRQLAMCVKCLRKWDEVVWEPNVAFNAVELSGEPEIMNKVLYTMLNPVSARLVRTPQTWPGVVTTAEVLERGTLRATRPTVWFKDKSPAEVTLELSTPPCFGSKCHFLQALGPLLQARLMRVRAEHKKNRHGYVGEERIRKTQCTASPTTKKPRFGTNPTFSALTRSAWKKAVQKLRAFRRAYRLAYEAWREGALDIEFPEGTWWLTRYTCATT